MPTWRNTLPPAGRNTGFDLRRTPTSSTLTAIVTSDDLVICDTHFWRGRTIPCERLCNEAGKTIDDSPCPACREKIGFRTHAYVSAYDPKKSEHFIYECTAHAATAFADYRQAVATLRGCIFHALRPKGTPNGKVSIETATANLQKVKLPNPPSVQDALAIIWRLPATALGLQPEPLETHSRQNTHATAAPTVRVSPDRMAAMRTPPDNDGTPQSVGDILRQTAARKRNGKPTSCESATC